MGRTSNVICFMLALLTVLSVTPAFLLFCACELSPGCLATGFKSFLVGPLGVRKPAVVVLLAPLVVTITFVVVFVRCHRRRDVLDFSESSRGMRAKTYPRHCEPTGRREAPPDDRLRGAIQLS